MWGIVLLVALPRGLGDRLLGGIWRPTYPLVLPVTLSVVGACVSAGATAGLHALAAARRSLRAMVLGSAVFLVCGLVGAVTGGAVGAMRGAAVAMWIGALLSGWQLHLALLESGHVPAGYYRGLHRRGVGLTPPPAPGGGQGEVETVAGMRQEGETV